MSNEDTMYVAQQAYNKALRDVLDEAESTFRTDEATRRQIKLVVNRVKEKA